LVRTRSPPASSYTRGGAGLLPRLPVDNLPQQPVGFSQMYLGRQSLRPAAILPEIMRFFLGSPGRPWMDLYGAP
jgi:hypothetical protein